MPATEPSRARLPEGRGCLWFVVLALGVGDLLPSASATAAAPAPVDGWWTKPRVAVENVGNGATPSVTRGPGRYTVVKWLGRRGGKTVNLTSSRELGEREFGKPRRLPGPRRASTRVEMGLGGDTLVSWYDPELDSVGVTTRTPKENWSEAVELADSIGISTPTWTSVAPDGGMIVVWRALNDDGSVRMETALRTADGGWGDPFTVVEDWEYFGFVEVVLGSSLNGAAIWRTACDIFDPDRIFPTEAVIMEGGEFGPVEEIENSECPHTFFSLAIDDAGRTVAAVNGYDFEFLVKAAVREPGESFGPAEQLNGSQEDAFRASVAASPDGETALVWRRERGGRPAGVRAALGDPDGLGPAHKIVGGRSFPQSYPPGLVMNAAGDVAVLVIRPTPRREQQFMAAYRDGDRNRFRRPEIVSEPLPAEFNARRGDIGMGNGGTPSIAWLVRDKKRERWTFEISERRSNRR